MYLSEKVNEETISKKGNHYLLIRGIGNGSFYQANNRSSRDDFNLADRC